MAEVPEFKLKAIMFDVDDTLIPTTKYANAARKQAIEEMVDTMQADGFNISERRVNKLLKKVLAEYGPDHKHQFETLAEKLGLPKEYQSKYASAAVEGFRQLRPSLKPYARVTSTLQKLEGYGLYGVTKGNGMHQWGKIRSSHLVLLLDNAFITEPLGFKEKNEEFYKAVLGKLKLEGKYCVMVGDRIENDIVPARKCGIHTVRVLTGKYKRGNGRADEEADYTIKRFSSLLSVIPKIEKIENDKLKTAIDNLVK